MTKLRIEISGGVLEVEGEESFVREVYKDYKESLLQSHEIGGEKEAIVRNATEQIPRKKVGGKKKTSNKKTKRKESYKLLGNLDLSSKNGGISLKDFYESKAPSNAMEKNVVFVYYLQKKANLKDVGVNHIYTCYKNVDTKVPIALRQSLFDTSHRKGWFDTESIDDITISTAGENYIEHELSAKSAKED